MSDRVMLSVVLVVPISVSTDSTTMVLPRVPELLSTIRSLPLDPISVSRPLTVMVFPAVASEITSFVDMLVPPVMRSRLDTERVEPTVWSVTPRVPVPLIPDQTSVFEKT